jgi:hypothetical protein
MGVLAVAGAITLVLSMRKGGGGRTCPSCGRVVMADWTRCLFCKSSLVKADPGRPAMLHFVTGPLANQVLALEKPVTTIGSVAGNDVVLSDQGVSRKHVGIRKVDGGYELADFGSTNGVYVNGEKIPRKRLDVGDVIRVGNTEIVFRTQ